MSNNPAELALDLDEPADELSISSATMRKLWPTEHDHFRDHLLRLDKDTAGCGSHTASRIASSRTTPAA